MKEYNLVIIGGGCAGMAAAVSAYDSGVRGILILEYSRHLGGVLLQCVHAGFGLKEFKTELTGPEYASFLKQEIEERKIEYLLNTTVYKITADKKVSYASFDEGYKTIKARAIVLASGCRERTRDQIFLPGSRPSGIMTAGLAQRYLNIDGYLVGKRVFILGSGNIGLIMARRMTLEGAKVLGVAEILPYSSGLARNICQCLDDFHIPLYLSHTITNIKGKARIEEIEISEVDKNRNPIPGTEKSFSVDTLLLSVGLIASQELLRGLDLKIDSITKLAEVSEEDETSIPGIFLCGNCLQIHDLADGAVEEARKVGKNVKKYLDDVFLRENKINVKKGPGIKYVLPNTINLSDAGDRVEFTFRVQNPLRDTDIDFKMNERLIYSRHMPYCNPAVMVKIKVMKKLFLSDASELTVEVRPK